LAAILVVNPTSVVARVSPRPKVRLRLEKAISICCLTPGRLALASVGQIPKQLAGYLAFEIRLGEQLFNQGNLCRIRGSKLVRDGHSVGGADEVQLHPLDAVKVPHL
jgi:hypothetical protein